jgi:hypothetical protein
MNDISDLVRKIEAFCQGSKLINTYHQVSSMEEIDGLSTDFRRLCLMPMSFSISEDTYHAYFAIIISDRVPKDDFFAKTASMEEGIYLLSAMSDYLDSVNADFDFFNGQVVSEVSGDSEGTNVIHLVSELECRFSKPQL